MSTLTAHILALLPPMPWWIAMSLMSLSVVLVAATTAALLLSLWQRLSNAPAHQLKRYQQRLRLGWGAATLLSLTLPYLFATTPWLVTPLILAACMLVWLARVELQKEYKEER